MTKSTSQTKSGAPALVSGASIPDKLYFRIGDVAKLCGVEAYVLRFWESEFPQLKPNKSGTGQRLYRKRDVELALRIKHLLYEDGYTIAGARQVFASESRESKKAVSATPQASPSSTPTPSAAPPDRGPLQQTRAELREILGMLSTPARPVRSDEARSRSRTGDRGGPGLFDL